MYAKLTQEIICSLFFAD